MDGPARVCIVRLSAVGDVAQTLPALAHLRLALPRARLGWLVEERAAPLLRGHPHLDVCHVVPRGALRRAVRGLALGQALGMLADIAREVRAARYDLLLDFQGNAKSALAGLLAGVPDRLGYDAADCREASHCFTTRRLPPLPPRLHRVEKALALARAVAGPELRADAVVPVDASARTRAAAWWSGLGPRPRVLLAPGTGTRFPEKRWPAARFAALARLAKARTGGTVGVAYGAGEEALAAEVAAGGAHAPAAPPDLADLIGLLAEADLVVAPDSAPMHVAALLGVRTVGLFGPTDPTFFAPWGPRVAVVRAGAPCAACDRRRGRPRIGGTHTCLPALDEEEVFAVVRGLLEGG